MGRISHLFDATHNFFNFYWIKFIFFLIFFILLDVHRVKISFDSDNFEISVGGTQNKGCRTGHWVAGHWVAWALGRLGTGSPGHWVTGHWVAPSICS